MINIYKSFLRPLAFSLDAEQAHHLGLSSLGWLERLGAEKAVYRFCRVKDDRLAVKIGTMTLDNPIGLAAGLDKEGVALAGFASLGFGAIEVGTVTAEPQSGNPLPRIFRLERDQALINRMGFPSHGAACLADQLSRRLPLFSGAKVGINIGKTKCVDIDKAASDYLQSFEALKRYGDYFVLNISSPNTPELRKLQEPERLTVLLNAIMNAGLDGRPLLIKIAPDLDAHQLNEVIDTVIAAGATGLIATNTTFSRDGLQTPINETGGLSGLPLHHRSIEFVAHIYRRTQGKIPIIGVGGLFNAAQVWSMMEAGATAVQLYTGLIYEGPLLVRTILRDLLLRLTQENLPAISSIIGRKNGAFKGL